MYELYNNKHYEHVHAISRNCINHRGRRIVNSFDYIILFSEHMYNNVCLYFIMSTSVMVVNGRIEFKWQLLGIRR